jgi:hypothetical protein
MYQRISSAPLQLHSEKRILSLWAKWVPRMSSPHGDLEPAVDNPAFLPQEGPGVKKPRSSGQKKNSSQSMDPRNAVITGAAQGIGRAIAVRLAADGCNVVVNDLPANQGLLDLLVAEIEASGKKAVSFAGDVSLEETVSGLVEKCAVTYGSLDIVRLVRHGMSIWADFHFRVFRWCVMLGSAG